STGSGIHGGSATGGVINIVQRRDFRGLDARLSYANTFDTDAGATRMDLNAGMTFAEGRTTVTASASHSQANRLTVGDRNFTQRAIQLQMDRNRAVIMNAA